MKVLLLTFLLCSIGWGLQQNGDTFDTTIGDITFTQAIYTFTQMQDHFHSNNQQTWQQRYVVYNKYFDPLKGTVFISIGGEGPMKGISSGRAWLLNLAQQFSALVVSIEHRFYGESQPFGQDDQSYSPNNLRYLSVDQSLEDLAYFISSLKTDPNLIAIHKASMRNPFITIGGSYPGAMSAWFRYKYPHLTVGALASSAVINSIVNFTQYDFQIYLSTLSVNKQCPVNIQAFNQNVEAIIQAGGQPATDLKNAFNSKSLSDIEFLYYLADQWADLVQYGNSIKLCQMFQSDDFNDQKTQVIQYLQTLSGDGTIPVPQGYSIDDLLSTQYNYSANWRQWEYQVCSYFGWFQTANSNQPMRSQSINISYFINQCTALFGQIVNFDTTFLFEAFVPNAEVTNGYLGGLNMNTKNIIFTNGSEDPWQWASLTTSKNDMIARVSVCQGCAHGCELGLPVATDPQNLVDTRTLVSGLFKVWSDEYLAKQPMFF